MKRLTVVLLLAILSIAASAKEHRPLSPEESAKLSQKAQKNQEKAMKKAAKEREKAMKRSAKAQRKAQEAHAQTAAH